MKSLIFLPKLGCPSESGFIMMNLVIQIYFPIFPVT